MKAERRHELQTNELAGFLAQRYQKHRDHVPTVLWGIVAILAMITALTLWSSRRGSSQVQAWEEFDKIRNTDSKARPKHLKELIERHKDSDVALWAKLDLADQLCFEGREKMPIDREIATTYLKEAQQNYAAVLQSERVRPEMIRRSALAEAKCWELMGDREKAISSYEAAAEKYKKTVPELAETAGERAAQLAQPEAADFYKWLAEYKPPAAPTLNIPGLGPNFPPIGGDSTNPQTNTPATEESASATEPKAENKPESDTEKKPAEATDPELPAKPAGDQPVQKDEPNEKPE